MHIAMTSTPPFGGVVASTPAFPFLDSHAHLADPAFEADRDDVIARARQAGASAIVCIGESLAAADRAEALAREHPGFVYWTAGVHPHDAAGFLPDRDPPAIAAHLSRGAVAVGECGLDYHYDHSPKTKQRQALADQLALAREHDVPAVIHSREAEDDTAAVMREAGREGIRGVLHCFTGSVSLARAGIDAGWMISFSGIITFRKWTDEDLLRLVPDDALLVESDAPYLAPVPHRGRRNEPAWVARTVERLAAARGAKPSALGALCARNATRLFGLASPPRPAIP
ncbi:MAG TPA: TatD family hydrolase [Gemmatimonadaceae bacterium]|nr:TatD family hydrolase [Gemmatimonadaceae bacterium]